MLGQDRGLELGGIVALEVGRVGENLRDDQGMGFGGQVLASTRVALQGLLHGHSCCLFFPQALEPFFDPGFGVAQRGSKLRMRPVGMTVQQRGQIRTSGVK